MVAHFAGRPACPSGWVRATEAEGRMLVGAPSVDDVGDTVGTPLASLEDRTHGHGFSFSFNLGSKSISGAGGGNNSGASAGDHTISGNTTASSSGLPFVQLLPCVRP